MKLSADNAVSALAELSAAGYTNDFRIRDGQLVNISTGETVDPEGVQVDTQFRFETDPDSGDASNIYALSAAGGATKGFLVDALDLEGTDGSGVLAALLSEADVSTTHEGNGSEDMRYGLRKVRKAEFNEDPGRYVLRIGFPDFPECPFGQGFSILGYDTARQEYVWLVTRIIRDERLQRVPYQGESADA